MVAVHSLSCIAITQITQLTNILLHLNHISCREVINVLDRMGNTPLHYATQMWSQSVVRMLLERGANIGMKVRRKMVARLREMHASAVPLW